jgi:CHAT domain-containing protein
MGDENLPDEIIHFAATMLFAGFRGAVATMWSIRDDDGPKIARVFYEHFFKADIDGATESTPNHTEAARALQLAVAKLRAEGCSFK